jgi:hypothetical protein
MDDTPPLLYLAVSLYTNELFTDGEARHEQGVSSPSGGPGGAFRTESARKGLAAKRQERLQASTYAPNSFAKGTPLRPGAALPPSPSMRDSPSSLRPPLPGPAAPPLPTPAAPMAEPPMPSPMRASATQGAGMVHGLRGSYDPNEGQEEPRASTRTGLEPMGSGIGSGMRVVQPMDLTDMAAFLLQPGPKNGPMQCVIVRDRGSAKMYPRYSLFLEEGRRFLVAARKRKKQTTSNYIISRDFENLSRKSTAFFGKVRANFVGTEFTIYDKGRKPGKKGASADDPLRQELGAVTYQYNVLGTRGPRKMMAAIPAVDASGRRMFRGNGSDEGILERCAPGQGGARAGWARAAAAPRAGLAARRQWTGHALPCPVGAAAGHVPTQLQRPAAASERALCTCVVGPRSIKSRKNLDDLVVMGNKPPRWNDEVRRAGGDGARPPWHQRSAVVSRGAPQRNAGLLGRRSVRRCLGCCRGHLGRAGW